MLSMDEVKKKLSASRNWMEISRRSGARYSAIRNIALGQSSTVRVIDLQKLSDYFEAPNARNS